MAKKLHFLSILSFLSVIGSYIMLLMGAIVTKTGSGEGCGKSWPFCRGQLLPSSMPIETVIEYSHRVVSGFVGFIILLLAIMVWLKLRDRLCRLFASLSLFFVILQGALGAFTVVLKGTWSHALFLSMHFGFALIAFASVVLLMLRLKELKKEPSTLRIFTTFPVKVLAWTLLAYTYVVVYTGALVRHRQATMGCGYDFPLCSGTYLPDFYSQAGVHLLHRLAALFLFAFYLSFVLYIVKRYGKSTIAQSCVFGLVLIFLQILSGVGIVFSGGYLVLELLHTTVISLFFSVLCYICMQVGAPWKRKKGT